jgi:hypothetical protein
MVLTAPGPLVRAERIRGHTPRPDRRPEGIDLCEPVFLA